MFIGKKKVFDKVKEESIIGCERGYVTTYYLFYVPVFVSIVEERSKSISRQSLYPILESDGSVLGHD